MSLESKDKKGVTAAIAAAIATYLELEERARPSAIAPQRAFPSPWQLYGREEMMRMRVLWQQRIISKR